MKVLLIFKLLKTHRRFRPSYHDSGNLVSHFDVTHLAGRICGCIRPHCEEGAFSLLRTLAESVPSIYQ